MKIIALLGCLSLLLTLTACSNASGSGVDSVKKTTSTTNITSTSITPATGTTTTHNDDATTTSTTLPTTTIDGDRVIFNEVVIEDRIGRLRDRSLDVSEAEFRSKFDIDFSGLLINGEYDIAYSLYYLVDADEPLDVMPFEPDPANLYYGYVAVTQGDRIVFFARIANEYVRYYTLKESDIQNSLISNHLVQLFQLGQSLVSEFQLNGYSVFCHTNNLLTKEEMVAFTKSIIDHSLK